MKWLEMLLVAVGAESIELAAEWVLQYLGEVYNESFINVASNLGLLLHSKKMDAYTACAMWEEANCPARAQRIILRHLANFFGRRLTVPESSIKELEAGALEPISDSVEVGSETIHFWYRHIDLAILHRVKTEIDCRGVLFFKQQGYNSADIVFGGDHGARRFRAVVKLILRNNNNKEVKPLSVVLTVGSINCAKENRDILEKTIMGHMNQGLKRLVNKYLIAQCHNQGTTVTFGDEPPATEEEIAINGDIFCLSTRTFIAGDMSFFAIILGKENMSGKWCTWCMLSPKEWSTVGHEKGELWSIEGIKSIQHNVKHNNLSPTPQNLKGVTDSPLIDAVPVQNFILCVLHTIIGMGNTLVEAFLEWIEERVELLQPAEIEARNRVILASIQFEKEKNML